VSRPRVIQISDRAQLGDDELLRRVSRGGSGLAVQLRDPALEAADLLDLGRRLRRATREVGASLVVNDRLDLAILVEADGVHLGRRSVSVRDAREGLGPDAWVTCSAHSAEEALANARAGAQASLLSPIFSSPGKGEALGLEELGRARQLLGDHDHAVYALGGVDAERVASCLEAGADGVAAIRADLTTCA
jgi:thiamine-phosphate pyrophosphorylase